MTHTTPQQVKSAFNVILSVAETIREAGSIPSGTLYAVLMSKGCDEGAYNNILRNLKGANLVEETPAHLLRWIGPMKGVTR